MNFKNEIFQIISLILLTGLFQGPLNFFLMGAKFPTILKSLLWTLLLNLTTWMLYRSSFQIALDGGRVGIFLSAIVFGNALMYWGLLKFQVQSDSAFLEGRLWGWILFSPLTTLASIISTPLLAAILMSMMSA